MGFIKDSDAKTAAGHAARAAGEGRSAFLYRYVPAKITTISGPVTGAAEVIESIEGNGWRLESFAFDPVSSKHSALLLLFRRR